MRNRKRIIVSFMIVACMLMAVGFAALTDTLNIVGEAEVDYNTANSGFDADVYFSDASAEHTSDTAHVTTDPDMARFSVRSLAAAGEKANFTFVIQNDNEFSAFIKFDASKTTNSKDDYFTVEVLEDELEIPAGESVEVHVVVTLLQTPQLDAVGDKVTATFTLEYDVQDEEFN